MAAPAVVQHRPASATAYVEVPGVTVTDVLAGHVRPMPAWKRAADVIVAALALAVLWPVFLIIAAAILVESPGASPFFKQVRVGKGGRVFTCWKFRSMWPDAEARKTALMAQNEAHGHIFKLKNDPRRTRIGIILRTTSLDELPQLVNILRGDMSLIGPRPPLPAEVALYNARELRRLVVEPGVTGLWQVKARHRHDFEDMVRLDVEYSERRSPWLDLVILARTPLTILRGSGSC